MRALVCSEFGILGEKPPKLSLQELPDLHPNNDEILVEVKATSLNYPDLLMMDNRYQFKPTLPYIPGYELSGIVKEIGPGVTHINVGDAGVAITRIGGLAEQIIVPKDRFWKLSTPLNFQFAAAFPLAYGTSYHALKDRAKLQKNEKILILGAAGGVGLAAIQLSRLMGAEVIAGASTEEKRDICQKFGAHHTISLNNADLRPSLKKIFGEFGVDVILDLVGGELSELAFRSLAWNGRHLITGFTSGDIPRLPMNLPLLKGASIIGVAWDTYTRKYPEAGYKNILDLHELITNAQLTPLISAEFTLNQALDAIQYFNKRLSYGKIIILP